MESRSFERLSFLLLLSNVILSPCEGSHTLLLRHFGIPKGKIDYRNKNREHKGSLNNKGS